MTVLRWCPACDVGSTDETCWNCGQPFTATHTVFEEKHQVTHTDQVAS